MFLLLSGRAREAKVSGIFNDGVKLKVSEKRNLQIKESGKSYHHRPQQRKRDLLRKFAS